MKGFSEIFRTIRFIIFVYSRAIVSYVVPKKKGYYAFYPVPFKREFSGNIKALILYIKENHKQIDTVILSQDKNVIRKAQSHGLKTYKTILEITWASLRAEYILVDSSTTGDFRRGKFSLIQLWHGSGFKEVVLRNNKITKRERKNLELINRKYKLIVSTSKSEAKKQNISFESENAVVTGYPRNDVFFNNTSYFNELKTKYKFQEYKKIIAYIPTFRDTQPDPPFSNVFYQKLQPFLEQSNALFIVKRHPADTFLNIPKDYKNIRDVTQEITDAQELLLMTDILISDYSSVITDFALTKKPILIYPYDLEKYKKYCRPMYYDIEKILPQPFISDENDLLEKLKDDSWIKTPEAINSYEKFVKIFHKYRDGNSSKRAMQAIKNLSTKN